MHEGVARTTAILLSALLINSGVAVGADKKAKKESAVAIEQTSPETRISQMPPPPRYLVAHSTMDAIRNPKEIEEETGGRLGVALVDEKGALLLGFNRDDRFAMCSTFKAPLAAALLMGSDAGHFGLEGQIPFGANDILDHAPTVKKNAKRGRMSMEELAEAAVVVSDNSAANLLLPLIGGPSGLTSFLRRQGDNVSQLDRIEPLLNENEEGDIRDTTSPAAMAKVMAHLLFQAMKPESAQRLEGWMSASTTGDRRIKAGLPKGWTSGSKTGSCGTAYNDVAVVTSPTGERYVLAIYLDRPAVDGKKAEAAIAETASAALQFIGTAQKSGL